MLKRFTAVIITVVMLLACAACIAEQSASAPDRAEILELAEKARTRALGDKPLNDPKSEDAITEEGYEIIYDFATFYADKPELTKDTVLNSVVLTEPEKPVFRQIMTDMSFKEVIDSFPNTNPELAGTHDEAVLYIDGSPEKGVSYGHVLRDGQRIRAVEYGTLTPAEGGTAHTGVSFQIEANLVSAVQLFGLNNIITAEEAQKITDDINSVSEIGEYKQVPYSQNGQELAEFSEDDLVFPAFDFLNADPDKMEGVLEDNIVDNGDGTYLRVLSGDGYEAVFSCDADGKNAKPVTYTILSEDIEGPRCVRLGDFFTDVYNRFRHDDNAEIKNGSKVLYGTENTPPYGTCVYDDDGAELRYVLKTKAGDAVELFLRFDQMDLSDIILTTL